MCGAEGRGRAWGKEEKSEWGTMGKWCMVNGEHEGKDSWSKGNIGKGHGGRRAWNEETIGEKHREGPCKAGGV